MAEPRQPQIRITKIDTLRPCTAQPGIYIGRTFGGEIASPLANPYSAKKHGRIQAVEMYRVWLKDKVFSEKDPAVIAALTEIRDEIRAGCDVTLKCWCAPNLCHGEVIRDAVLTWEF